MAGESGEHAVQLVPVPRKRRLQYLEPQTLGAGSLRLGPQQALVRAEVRLACVHKHETLVAKEAELGRLLKLPAESQPAYVREYDSRGSRANTQRLGLWLGNRLNHCLFTQGPFCAAILLRANSPPPPSTIAAHLHGSALSWEQCRSPASHSCAVSRACMHLTARCLCARPHPHCEQQRSFARAVDRHGARGRRPAARSVCCWPPASGGAGIPRRMGLSWSRQAAGLWHPATFFAPGCDAPDGMRSSSDSAPPGSLPGPRIVGYPTGGSQGTVPGAEATGGDHAGRAMPAVTPLAQLWGVRTQLKDMRQFAASNSISWGVPAASSAGGAGVSF